MTDVDFVHTHHELTVSQTSACPAAIEAAAAKSQGVDGLSYVVGDVTRLPSARLGTFDFFLDIGCFQGLDAEQRVSEGEVSLRLPNRGPHCCW